MQDANWLRGAQLFPKWYCSTTNDFPETKNGGKVFQETELIQTNSINVPYEIRAKASNMMLTLKTDFHKSSIRRLINILRAVPADIKNPQEWEENKRNKVH